MPQWLKEKQDRPEGSRGQGGFVCLLLCQVLRALVWWPRRWDVGHPQVTPETPFHSYRLLRKAANGRFLLCTRCALLFVGAPEKVDVKM